MDIKTEGTLTTKTCIVVDENDNALRIGDLAECHIRPMTLHRAFSLFVFDEQGRMLLQQRAKSKYTFPLAWTNTVCSHPRNDKKTMEEWIDLRVQDELGWTVKNIHTRLKPVGKLTYEAYSDFQYGEKEIDTLYILHVTEEEKANISLNKDEVEAIDWVDSARLNQYFEDDRYLITPWFRAIVNGFGHPFYDNVKAVEQHGYASKSVQDQVTPAEEISTEVTTFTMDDRTLPWFHLDNCSMPKPTDPNDFLLQLPFSYLSSNPGKSLRTEMVKLYADLDKDLKEEDVKGISSIIERIHAASLLHDDIEDKSSSRRGAVCAHMLWGTAQTINTGTFNFLKAVQSVDEQMAHKDESVRSAMMRQTLQTIMDLHRGQNSDIFWGEHAMCPSLEDYISMIDHKTGALFQACARLGSIASGNTELGDDMSQQFKALGRFFQIRDDLCNICDPVYWKGKGFYEDADEGKYSYPVLQFFGTSDNEDAEWLRNRLANREEPMSIEEKLRAYEMLYNSNALHETRQQCLHMVSSLNFKSERAKKIIDVLYVCEIKTPEKVKQWLQEQS